MQKNTIVLLFFATICIVGCAPKRHITILPCQEVAIDDSLFVRELGHGTSMNLQLARNGAIQDAKIKIINHFCDSLRTFMPQVIYNQTKDSLSAGLSDTILFQYPLSYFGELSYTRKECERITFDTNKQYHCFITLVLPKTDIEHASNKVFRDLMNYMAELAR